MSTVEELLAKADDIIKAPRTIHGIKVPETFDEYKEKITEFYTTVVLNESANMKSHLCYVEYLTQPHILDIVNTQWLLTSSATLRWSMNTKGDKIKSLYNNYYIILQDYIDKKHINGDKIISDLKWLDEFAGKSKTPEYYYYEAFCYLFKKMNRGNWRYLLETDKKYVSDFINKLNGTDLTYRIKSFKEFHSIA